MSVCLDVPNSLKSPELRRAVLVSTHIVQQPCSLSAIIASVRVEPLTYSRVIFPRSWAIKKYGRWTSEAALLYQRDEFDIWRRVQQGFFQLRSLRQPLLHLSPVTIILENVRLSVLMSTTATFNGIKTCSIIFGTYSTTTLHLTSSTFILEN